MANRFWVGGAGAWNGTAGTKWATTSGGTGGQAVPTVADDVFFDAASGAVAVTTSGAALCRSLDCTGFTGTLDRASISVTIGDASGGALTLGSGMTVAGANSFVMASTSSNGGTGWPVTTNGVSIAGGGGIQFNGAGGKWTLQDGLTTAGSVTLTQGTLDTNSKTVAASVFTTGTSTSTKTLTAGSTVWTLSNAGSAFSVRGTGTTITSNTSVVNLTGAGSTMSISSTAVSTINYNGMSFVLSGSGASAITAAAGSTVTLGSLTRTGTAATTDILSIQANGSTYTLTGSVNFSGQALSNRLLVASDTRGTAVTLTVAGGNTIANVDFMDVTAAGAGGTWSGSSLGDCQGNSNITFTTPVTRYAVVAGTTNATSAWSTTSGGSGGASIPLPQDTVIFNAASGAGTYSQNVARIGASIDFTGFTRTLSNAAAWETYGDVKLATGMTVSGTGGALTLAGRGSPVFTPATKTWTSSLVVNCANGTYTLGGNFLSNRTGAGAFSIASGTFNDASFSVGITASSGTFSINGGTLTASGTWTFSQTNTATFWSNGGGTVNHTGTIVVGGSSTLVRTFAGGGGSYGTLTYVLAGSTGQLTISGNNTFDTINFSDASNARTLSLAAGATNTILTAFNVNGTAGKLMTITSASTSALTKASGVVSCDYLAIDHSFATGGAAWYAGANSTDNGNNTGWIFTAPSLVTDTGFFALF